MTERTRNALLALALALLAVGPYLPSLRGSLVWDDRKLIEQETRFFSPHFLREVWTNDFFSDVEDSFRYGYYRPLVSIGYFLTWRAYGTDPRPYHVTNVLLHLAVVLLLFLIAVRVLGLEPGWGFLAAALFAVHPVHVESVAWIAGRTDVQCALFLGLSVLAAGEGLRRCPAWPWWLAAAAAQVAAMLSKEMAVVWPIAAAVPALAAPVREDRRRWRPLALAVGAATAAVLAGRFLAAVSPPARQWSRDELLHVPVAALAGLGIDIERILWPSHPAPYIQNPLGAGLFRITPLLGMLFLGGLLAGILRWRGRRPQEAAVATFLAASLVPLLNVLRIAAPEDMGLPVADRFLYIPSAAASLLLVMVLARSRAPVRTIAVALLVVALPLLAARTVAFQRVWQDEPTLFRSMVSRAPAAVLPHQLLGSRLAEDGRWDEAERELETALELARRERLRPAETVAPRNDLAGVLTATGKAGHARRILQEIVREGHGRAGVLYNLAVTDLALGDRGAARNALDACLQKDPWHRKALLAAARLALSEDRVDEAERLARRLEDRYGATPTTCLVHAIAAGRRGDEEGAGRWLARALELGPDDRDVLRTAAGWRISRHEWKAALDLLIRMLRLDPEDRWAAIQVRRIARETGDPLAVAKVVLPALGRTVPAARSGAEAALQSLADGGHPEVPDR